MLRQHVNERRENLGWTRRELAKEPSRVEGKGVHDKPFRTLTMVQYRYNIFHVVGALTPPIGKGFAPPRGRSHCDWTTTFGPNILHPRPLRPIIVCADDYGLSAGVSQAILELISAGRISATSCMTSLPGWARDAAALSRQVSMTPADIGLHLTLTDHAPLHRSCVLARDGRLPSLHGLLARALSRRLKPGHVIDEVRAQLDAFEDAWGAPPDHIDGHQHVHLLPGIRDALLAELIRRYPLGRVWVRDCVEAPVRSLRRGESVPKSMLINLLGLGLRHDLRRAGIRANDGFSGLHDFDSGKPFSTKMRSFIGNLGPRPLVHVHPGRVDAELRACDTLTTPREAELAYLISDTYLHDLTTAGLKPARMTDLMNEPILH